MPSDREAEAASAEDARRLAMADVWRAGKDSPRFRHTSRPAVLTASGRQQEDADQEEAQEAALEVEEWNRDD